MKAYRVTGRFEMGWAKRQGFVKEVAAADQKGAREDVYSVIGSKHKVKRRQIVIEKVEEVPLESVEDPIIRQKAGGK